MTSNKSRYYAKVKQKNNSLKISEGSKPLFKTGFGRYVEVYLPSNYHKNLTLNTTSGDITCSKLTGNVAYTSTSGNLEVLDAKGSGSYRANNSGQLKIAYTQVDNDLYLANKNDDVSLTLPASLGFQFEAETKNGTITTDFSNQLKGDPKKTTCSIGNNPTLKIKIETHDGNIQVSRQ